jgi:cytidine deaminase
MSNADKMPVKRFEKMVSFELMNFEDLDQEEQAVVASAIAAQAQSEDKKFQAGAAARAYDGTMVATHNDIPGPHGHAEQRVISQLYEILKPGHKKLKILALAAALPGEELIRKNEPHTENVALDEIEWAKPCGKCLEFMHDISANVDDVKILSVASTGQVMRTSLRSLITSPHTSVQVPYDPVRGAPVYGTVQSGNGNSGTSKA